MDRGFVVLAQNNDFDDYVKQACILAMSLHKTNPNEKISIITNHSVPEEYVDFFDKIIPIPWDDLAVKANWKIENRWKIYHVTPYEKTIVLDTDMLVLSNIEHFWDTFEKFDVYYTSSVSTYRGEKAINDYYRKAFVENNLPNLYSGMHYFRKCEFAHEFYAWLELISRNWKDFYDKFIPIKTPMRNSMDVNAALVAKILDCKERITNEHSTAMRFVHMKSKAQGWNASNESWQDTILFYVTDDIQIKIGNYLQRGIFHYTEKDFIDNDVEQLYRDYFNVK